MEIVFGIFLIVVAVIVFAAWACVHVIGAILRAVFGSGKPSAPEASSVGLVSCPQARCRAANPGFARFCRRCGRAVAAGDAGRAARMRYVA